MSVIDTIKEVAHEIRDKDGNRIVMLRGDKPHEYHVSVPYDSGYAYTTISGTFDQCVSLLNLFEHMHVGKAK